MPDPALAAANGVLPWQPEVFSKNGQLLVKSGLGLDSSGTGNPALAKVNSRELNSRIGRFFERNPFYLRINRCSFQNRKQKQFCFEGGVIYRAAAKKLTNTLNK
jgi:hypothetical protein